MAMLAWDRLLETCMKRKMSAMLAAGSIPMVRCGEQIRQLQVPPISAEELASMLHEIMPAENEMQNRLGARTFTVRYGSEFGFLFEVRGEPVPTSVTISQLW
jgi:Tfp pilus assembly pilus retraction ATPase PilT